jgi:hypothetical protein
MHMRLLRKFMAVGWLALAIPSLATAAFDANEPILCAIRDVNDCGASYACMEVTPEAVALPDFFAIDLAGKSISSVGTTDVTASPIERVERLNGKLILQGGDASGDNPRGGVGWTLTLNEDDGKLVIAGVGDGFALVVFGSCVQQ